MATDEKKPEQWAASRSGGEDRWEIYSSREEAIDSAPDDLGLEPGDNFVVSRAYWEVLPDLADMLVDAVESWVCDNAPETCGEELVADFRVGPAAEDLKQVLADWAKRHDVKPDWFACEGAEESHEVPIPDSMKMPDPDAIPF